MPQVRDTSAEVGHHVPHNYGQQRMVVPPVRARLDRGLERRGGNWASASDSDRQPHAATDHEGSQQEAGRKDVRRHHDQADCEEGGMIAAPMGTDDEGSRTGALGSPPAAEKIDAAQLPRPPEQPPVLAAACAQENGTDSGCQAMDIAPDTLPRPPEPDRMAALTADALASIVMVFGDKAPEELPPGLLETWVKLTGRGWGELAR
jgi:hypothetical protein